jgi:hypothetical protein
MPAITLASFGAGLADRDLILGTEMSILSAKSRRARLRGQRHHRNQPGSGTERRDRVDFGMSAIHPYQHA